jgi:DNA-binding response OmpR family regulator
MKVLVVDDHVLIREALRGVLRELDGAATILEASDGAAAMHLIEGHGDLGLVLLDLTLPDRDGFSLLAGIRECHPGVSIVVMSALQDRATVTRALDLGALGFIPKSARREVMLSALRLIFSGGVYIPPQILAREAPTTKHSQGPNQRARVSPADLGRTGRRFLFENYVLDSDRRELHCGGAPVPVEPQVFDLLEYLLRHREQVVSKDDLLSAIWGGRIVSESALSTRMNAARNAIGDSGEEQRLIRTVLRKGFRFVGAVREERAAP